MKNVTYINAGAGSGKTYRLTETLTQLIKEGKAKPEQVILTTFTTKAANEFKEKAKAFLFDDGMYEEAVQLDHAMIGTVHSVCQKMIGKYWFNLGLSPNMGVMAEEDTIYYISQSLAELPTEAELKQLHAFARYFDVRTPREDNKKSTLNYDFWQVHLKKIIDFATNYEIDDFTKSEVESLNYIRQFVTTDGNYDFTYEELKAIIDEHEAFLRSQKQSNTNDKRIDKLVQAKHYLHRPTLGTLKDINSTIGTPKGYGPLADAFSECMANIWTSKMVYDKQESYIKLLFNLAKRWKENFAQFKRDKNLLDYNDMEKYMRLLMQNDSIASEISQSYHYLFVDEYQDSSPIQVKIFDALSDLMEHSYWVGDYKQAIYGFRGSDIALTKAVVDRVAKKENGCDTDTLEKSWRSLPDIVDVNNAVFEKTFADVLDKKNIHLDQVRNNEHSEESLRYFVIDEECGVAEHVLKLLNNGAKPNEIAVLARTNLTLATLAKNLQAWDIPSSREDCSVIDSQVYDLVAALLRIVGSNKDTLSKATVAILTEPDYTIQQIIESKILNDANEHTKDEDYLVDVPIISQLLTIRPRLQQQSVASLVESMIIELNLYDVSKKINSNTVFATSCLQTIINTARVYEDHCVQMNLPATIDGFLAYIEEVKPVSSGDPNGVQLHTYHSCKGLQWKYVILMSLNDNVSNLKKSVKNETYGVHAIHSDVPSAENPYPEVYIRLTPWIYGTSTNVPDTISVKIEESQDFKLAYKSMLAETNRVFYVGMTRPQDVLILCVDKPKKGATLLQWPKDIGIDTTAENIPNSGDWDVFGTGHWFKNFSLTQDEINDLKKYGEVDKTCLMPLNINSPLFEKSEHRYISPSRIHTKGYVASHNNFQQRIPFGKQPSDMSTVGDCIHQIFAGIEEERLAYKIELKEIIMSYGLGDVLTDYDTIIQAWQNLYIFLTEKHGSPIKTYHERPFRLERNGQTVVGSIDLVWKTSEGDILVDFKTCPMGMSDILDADSKYYAGWYAGQLDAYEDALEAAGEKVLKRYIYYPVSGLLAEVTRTFKALKLSMYDNVYRFDVCGIDLDKAINEAIECFEDKIYRLEMEPNDNELANHTYVIEGKSTQGINLTLLNTGMVNIMIPYLASRVDIAFAFGVLCAVKAQDSDVVIYDNDEETIADLSEENETEVYYYRLDNMAFIIEEQDDHIGVQGFKNEFHIKPEYIKSITKSDDPREWILKAYRDFADIQWNYDGYDYLSLANITSPEGEKFEAKFLTNNKGFAKVCQKVVLFHGQASKMIDINTFLEKAIGNKYIKRLDYTQFVIDKMPKKEWEQFYNLFDKEPVRVSKTYILRWNPQISSFRSENYQDAVERFPNGFQMNWSIYEWEEAHSGDDYYMLRVGDNQAGVVFRGKFLSEPYEGDDWAGKGKKRYYVDINCLDACSPHTKATISIEELQKAIPEINWERGHSGELLTKEQELKLYKLWLSKYPE